MNPIRRLASAPLLLAALLATAAAPKPGAIRIEAPWVRPVAAGLPATAAYATFRNTGRTEDAVIAVSTPAASVAGVHESVSAGGVMSMKPVPRLALRPGATVTLKPGGLHIMLERLRAPLRAGETVPVTFTFQRAKPVTVKVPVQAFAP